MQKASSFTKIAKYISLSISLIVFIFSLVSGSESFGGGLWGVIQNSPNALPWFVLLVIQLIVFKWPKLGGSLLVGFGIITLFFFRTWQHPVVFLIITLPLIAFGIFFMSTSGKR